jgi:hypothetical protein
MKRKRITPSQRGEVNLLLVATVVLGIFVLIFAGLFVNSYMKAQEATKNVNAKRAEAYKLGQEAGAKTQKATDEAAAKAEAQNPYRSYVAPTAFGEFTIKFPKNWSSSVAENISSTNQVDLIATPEFIKILPNNSVNYALRVTLVNTPYDTVKAAYDQQAKNKKSKAMAAKVSGIDGTRYEGQYRQNKTGIAVLVPVRDKTMVFVTENTKYQPEFEATLTQSTIKP